MECYKAVAAINKLEGLQAIGGRAARIAKFCKQDPEKATKVTIEALEGIRWFLAEFYKVIYDKELQIKELESDKADIENWEAGDFAFMDNRQSSGRYLYRGRKIPRDWSMHGGMGPIKKLLLQYIRTL